MAYQLYNTWPQVSVRGVNCDLPRALITYEKAYNFTNNARIRKQRPGIDFLGKIALFLKSSIWYTSPLRQELHLHAFACSQLAY